MTSSSAPSACPPLGGTAYRDYAARTLYSVTGNNLFSGTLAVRYLASTLSPELSQRVLALLGLQPLVFGPGVNAAELWYGVWASTSGGAVASTLSNRAVVVFDPSAGTQGATILALPRLSAMLATLKTEFLQCADSRLPLALAHLAHLDVQVANQAFALLQEQGALAAQSKQQALGTRLFLSGSLSKHDSAEWALALRTLLFHIKLVNVSLTEAVVANLRDGGGTYSYQEVAPRVASLPNETSELLARARAQRVVVAAPAPLPPPPTEAPPEPKRLAPTQRYRILGTRRAVGDETGNVDAEIEELDESSVMPAAEPPRAPSTPQRAPTPLVAPGAPAHPQRAVPVSTRDRVTGRVLVFEDDAEIGDEGADETTDEADAPASAVLSAQQLATLRANPELRAFAHALRLEGADVRTVARLYMIAHTAPTPQEYEHAFKRHAPARLHQRAQHVHAAASANTPSAQTRSTLLALCDAAPPLSRRRAAEARRFARFLEQQQLVAPGSVGDADAVKRYAIFYSTPGLDAWRAHFGEARGASMRALAALKEREPSMSASMREFLYQLVPAHSSGSALVTFE